MNLKTESTHLGEQSFSTGKQMTGGTRDQNSGTAFPTVMLKFKSLQI